MSKSSSAPVRNGSTFQVLKCHCACVIFNMALLQHKFGVTNKSAHSFAKAGQLYRLCIQLLKEFVVSLTSDNDNKKHIMDGTSILVMLASLNNLSHLLYAKCNTTKRAVEATIHMQFMSRLMNATRQEMLGAGMIPTSVWSSFALNAMVVSRRLSQAAGAA